MGRVFQDRLNSNYCLYNNILTVLEPELLADCPNFDVFTVSDKDSAVAGTQKNPAILTIVNNGVLQVRKDYVVTFFAVID